ncbi:MAG: 23S rRNA (pseudouridine(1915)-N(3))-methyltransferase RlmH [Clostridia bacterium]|nr:23S rRNA (pseudouridine(1915)-N(3))-methyltransferase RlmH [Clostridia bacterium]
MNINIVCVGKLKEKYWRDAVAEYSKRLSRFCSLTITELKEERLPDNASPAEEQKVIDTEGQNILRAVKNDDYVIALDVKGKGLSSEQLAEKIGDLGLQGRSNLVMIIGGSLGLSEDVCRRADFRLSFSAMTFPHQMMRVILLEQVYRAFKILHNETYHK